MSAFFIKSPTLLGVAATNEQIEITEKVLLVVMDNDFKEFILNFGGAYEGIAIYAFKNGTSIGKETIIDLTMNARNLFNTANLFPEINNCLVFSDDGAGNPIAIAPNGEVILFDYDIEEKQKLANSFEKLIEDNFIN
ncbi:SMI1/KNR4 family protein [Prevotella aurantiaca]|uniref:SMI1/KNR4 family protein n=1 Tax=Prevotella aurantiaca TaxID=596085 RepID=UPI002889B60D|nr:SMI1/KNR4 family protein [Prevotella aurantiaca]